MTLQSINRQLKKFCNLTGSPRPKTKDLMQDQECNTNTRPIQNPAFSTSLIKMKVHFLFIKNLLVVKNFEVSLEKIVD